MMSALMVSFPAGVADTETKIDEAEKKTTHGKYMNGWRDHWIVL